MGSPSRRHHGPCPAPALYQGMGAGAKGQDKPMMDPHEKGLTVNEVTRRTAAHLGIIAPTFRSWVSRRGKSHVEKGEFTLPSWILKEPREYQISYIAHEVAHFHPATHGVGHGSLYNAIEEKALALWGLYPHTRSPRGNRYIRALSGPSGFIPGSESPASPYLTSPNEPEPLVRRPCECGCGQQPKGRRSRFLPGHDSRVR